MLRYLDRRATAYAIAAVVVLLAAIYAGSGRLRYLDPALVAYTMAVVFATFGIVYRYGVWLQKPPTALYWRKGWALFLRPRDVGRNVLLLLGLLWSRFVTQTFIERRARTRWLAHFLLSWGCIAAVLVTFPLVFGWIHFDPSAGDARQYRVVLLGFHAGSFPVTSPIGWATFHILDICAVAVLLGMVFAFKRRMYDRGALSLQSFAMDFLPLVMLFAVCITGLMLTVSSLWLRGYSYSVIAILHAFSVIVTLLYLPFGKFFHVFQRPANLGVDFYKREGRAGPQAECGLCGLEFASRMHVDDLAAVLHELGMDYGSEAGEAFAQVCPGCRRRLLAMNQLRELHERKAGGFI